MRAHARAMLHGRSGLPCTSYRAPPSIDSHSKAFDRCSWEFMLEGLTAVGFNDRFVNYPDTFASHTLSSTPREDGGGEEECN